MLQLKLVSDKQESIILDRERIQNAMDVIAELSGAVEAVLYQQYPEVKFEVSVDTEGQLTLWSNRTREEDCGCFDWHAERVFDLFDMVVFVNDAAIGDTTLD